MAVPQWARYITVHGIHPLRARASAVQAPALPADPGAHAGAEFDHLAGALRRPYGDPSGGRAEVGMGVGGDRVRSAARWHRWSRCAAAQGHVAFWRRTRQL